MRAKSVPTKRIFGLAPVATGERGGQCHRSRSRPTCIGYTRSFGRAAVADEDVACPMGKGNEQVGMANSPHVERQTKLLAPHRLGQIARIQRIGGPVRDRRLIGAADVNRRPVQVAPQRAEEVGFEQVNHHGIERRQLVQDRPRLLDDARAHEQRVGQEAQPARHVGRRVVGDRCPPELDFRILLRILAQVEIARHVADRGVQHEPEAIGSCGASRRPMSRNHDGAVLDRTRNSVAAWQTVCDRLVSAGAVDRAPAPRRPRTKAPLPSPATFRRRARHARPVPR